MNTLKRTTQKLLELANQYPSPHNGQPIRLKQVSADTFDLFFDNQRGLQSTEISYIFSFVSMGVFVRHLAFCAQALGHTISFNLCLPQESKLHGRGIVKFASCTLGWAGGEEDKNLLQALRFRQTSRKKYYEGIGANLAGELISFSKARHMSLARLNKRQAKETIWLNQRAVFDDMFNEPVRRELSRWLRYTKEQKQEQKDGLAYDCMEINGAAMKYIVNHPRILRMPGIARLLQQYYLRTMADSSDVFYMLAPFASEENAFEVGRTIMEIWIKLSGQGYYLHPFGTIMSNDAAHRDFLKLAKITDESRDGSYLVFIFRAGKSEPPVRSLRIPFHKHLLLGQS